MPWAALAASAVSGVTGMIQQNNADNRADMLRNEALQKWLAINIPDPEEQKLALQQFVVAGKLTPTLEQAIRQDPSVWNHVVQDQGLKQSQLRSLRSLEDLGSGKETFDDQAARENAMIDESAAERGHQKAITSSLAQRGQLGTGLELTARMGQQQADADTAAKTALGLEANRRASALKAIEASGNQANQMSQQDLALKGQQASAADAINRFNAQNAQNVTSANAKAKTSADLYNLENAQDVSNKNTALNNYEQQYNKNLLQQKFNNETQLAAGETGQYNKSADQAVANGKNSAEFWGNLASTAPKVINAASNYEKNNPSKKDEEEDPTLWAGGDTSSAFGNIG